MSNYSLIKDESVLNDFIQNVLPDERENEMFMICLFARQKYCPEIKIGGDKNCLKRVTATKDRIVTKIRQMEIAEGGYLSKDEVPLPQKALAIYITINPRNLELAAKKSLIKLATVITEKYNGYNPHQLVMSEIQKSAGKKTYTDFDFDNLEFDEKKFSQILDDSTYKVLKSRGGFHLLVKHEEIVKNKNTWYRTISSMPNCDVSGDCLIPIPGCTQSEFMPYMIKQ